MIMMGFGGMMLFGIAVLFAVVLFLQDLPQSVQVAKNSLPLSPRQILDQRYANGEINQEQYYSMINQIK
ncbi:MAG: hypothetical protein ACD_35C00126G0004 [uncultured bacterium]|nr:MAG: hypothetical protein ACD_35C00126G0004 [uncultured bacterium]